MAHHDSFAGKSYNPFCYHYLINRIRAITQAKKFDIVEKLLEMLKTTIPEIVDVTPDEINAIQI